MAARRAQPLKKRSWLALPAVLFLAVAVAGCNVRIPAAPGSGAGDATAVTNGPTPSLANPLAVNPSAPTEGNPFHGSPAASYADGAAGIAIPPAHALPGYPTAQVARAYRIAKRMLVDAGLDAKTLQGGSPQAFANLLTSQQRAFFVKGLDKIGLTRKGFERSTRGWVTSFAPGTTQFDGNVIKVHGLMAATVAKAGQDQLLRVHANYLFVYPVQQPGQPATLMRIVVHGIVNVDFARWDDPQGGPLEAWWSVAAWEVAGGRCDVNDGFIHPQFPHGAPDKVQPSGALVHPYSLTTPPKQRGCGATTGT